MLQIIPKTNIDFVGKRYTFFTISAILLAVSIGSLILKGGPKWGLDFTGGNLIEIKFTTPPAMEDMRKALREKEIPSFELQSTSEGLFIIRTQLQKEAEEQNQDIGSKIQNILEESFPNQGATLMRKEFVGPTIGKHLFRETSFAFILTFLGIIIYVAFRFHSGIWGFAGIVALLHDVIATIGILSLLNKEITVTIVAALLTIAGYSINDTIVIFDFMREKMKLLRSESQEVIINRSINETLSRTIITNLTVFMVVLVLYFFGGEVIHDFAFAMVFGAIVGTYSSIAVAAPIIYEWTRIQSKKK